MSIGTHKFFASKLKIFLCLILSPILTCLSAFVFISHSDDLELLCGGAGVVLFSLFSIISLCGLFNKTPLLTITPEYVKIRNYDNLFWEDIQEIEEIVQQINNTKIEHLRFIVKDIEKYQLTKMQKFNKKVGGYAFEVGLNAFKQKDKEQIKQLITQIKNEFLS